MLEYALHAIHTTYVYIAAAPLYTFRFELIARLNRHVYVCLNVCLSVYPTVFVCVCVLVCRGYYFFFFF